MRNNIVVTISRIVPVTNLIRDRELPRNATQIAYSISVGNDSSLYDVMGIRLHEWRFDLGLSETAIFLFQDTKPT